MNYDLVYDRGEVVEKGKTCISLLYGTAIPAGLLTYIRGHNSPESSVTMSEKIPMESPRKS